MYLFNTSKMRNNVDIHTDNISVQESAPPAHLLWYTWTPIGGISGRQNNLIADFFIYDPSSPEKISFNIKDVYTYKF